MKTTMPGGLLALLLVLAACSSATTLPLKGSPEVPAAAGEVNVSEGPNQNTRVELTVEHLASPERLRPGAKTFVVWARPTGGQPQNLGALKVDEDLKGKLETLTPFTHFDLLVTAESDAQVTAPTSEPVLSARVAR